MFVPSLGCLQPSYYHKLISTLSLQRMCQDFKVCAITLLYENRVTLIRTKNKFKIQIHGCYHFMNVKREKKVIAG